MQGIRSARLAGRRGRARIWSRATDEVVIRVHAAGVNFPDALIIQDKYQFKPTLPFSPGGECAGVVEAVGARCAHLRRAMRVTGVHDVRRVRRAGARATRATLIPMPDELDFVDRRGVRARRYATSYHALVDRGALQRGRDAARARRVRRRRAGRGRDRQGARRARDRRGVERRRSSRCARSTAPTR